MGTFSLNLEKLDFHSQEAYKTLRTNIEFSGVGSRIIYITSSAPGEGKSTTSLELALAFSDSGKRTLLIDADLRKSHFQALVQQGTIEYGLTHYLVEQASLDQVIQQSDIDDFDMIFAGPVPPNPSELLDSARFAQLIEYVRSQYDIVIIDTPPLGSVIDAAVISKQCDGGVIVIGSGDVSYKLVRKTKEQLELSGSKIIGCVLNKLNLSKNSYYYDKYYKGYYKHTY